MEIEQLRRENEKLTAELTRTKAALEVVGKAHALLELLSESADSRREAAEVTDAAFAELEPLTCVKRACELLGKSRATLHRQRDPAPAAEKAPGGPRAPHPAALTAAEQAALLAVLDSERFADKSPAQVWAILLDEGLYLASVRTMYRVLTLAEQVRERRAQAQHPPRVRPELVADGPDQVWTWDITKLKGPWRGTYFDLYLMIDIFSRKAIHQEVHNGEDGVLASAFMRHAIAANEGTMPRYIHADNGTSMTVEERRDAAVRPEHHPQPFPPARIRRQPLL